MKLDTSKLETATTRAEASVELENLNTIIDDEVANRRERIKEWFNTSLPTSNPVGLLAAFNNNESDAIRWGMSAKRYAHIVFCRRHAELAA